MPTHKYCLTIEKINLTNYGLRVPPNEVFGSIATQTHCLLLFHNKAKATDLDKLSTIDLLAEIAQKAGSLPFG